MEMKRTEKKHASAAAKDKDKLIFTTKVFSASKNVRVGINEESRDIVNAICLQTGMSASEIVDRMIAFCAERVEIIPGFYYVDDSENESL
jgi:hypothetical protein